jgi:hypothetical protein
MHDFENLLTYENADVIIIGVGDYENLACHTQNLWFQNNFINAFIFSCKTEIHPSWNKLILGYKTESGQILKSPFEPAPGSEWTIIVDSDIFSLRPFQIPIPKKQFAAVREPETHPIKIEKKLYGINNYFNAGFWIIHRDLLKRLHECFVKYHPRYGSWLEQTALNKWIQHEIGEWEELPREYNWMVHPNDDASEALKNAYLIHLCGLGSADKVTERAKKLGIL